jgi:Tol biopolymer transport system component
VATHVVTDIGVPEALGAGEPRYRPDGSVILFASRSAETSLGESQGNIYTVHPDGTALTQLTDTGATGASWTPDGRYIIYMSNWIYLMEPDGSNKARWSISGPDLSKTETGYGYTTYWIPAAP